MKQNLCEAVCFRQQQQVLKTTTKKQHTDIVYSNTEWPWEMLNVIFTAFQTDTKFQSSLHMH